MTTTLYMTMALNGAMATGQGETPWGEASWENFIAATEKAGNLIIGRKTYEVMKAEGSFGLLRGKPKVVVVSMDPGDLPDAILVTNPAAAIKELGDQETILVGGGPGLATSMIADGLIDVIRLDIEPILLGQGMPLITTDIKRDLELLDVVRYDGGITLSYKVKK